MDRRAATRALAGAAITGATLLDPLEGWLQPAGAAARPRRRGRLGPREVEELNFTARAFRAACAARRFWASSVRSPPTSMSTRRRRWSSAFTR